MPTTLLGPRVTPSPSQATSNSGPPGSVTASRCAALRSRSNTTRPRMRACRVRSPASGPPSSLAPSGSQRTAALDRHRIPAARRATRQASRALLVQLVEQLDRFDVGPVLRRAASALELDEGMAAHHHGVAPRHQAGARDAALTGQREATCAGAAALGAPGDRVPATASAARPEAQCTTHRPGPSRLPLSAGAEWPLADTSHSPNYSAAPRSKHLLARAPQLRHGIRIIDAPPGSRLLKPDNGGSAGTLPWTNPNLGRFFIELTNLNLRGLSQVFKPGNPTSGLQREFAFPARYSLARRRSVRLLSPDRSSSRVM